MANDSESEEEELLYTGAQASVKPSTPHPRTPLESLSLSRHQVSRYCQPELNGATLPLKDQIHSFGVLDPALVLAAGDFTQLNLTHQLSPSYCNQT